VGHIVQHYQMITTEGALNDLLNQIGTGHAALDFETTGLRPAESEVRLAQICNDDVWAVVDFWALPGRAFAPYADWFDDATWVAFNAGFEYQWFDAADAPHVRVIEVAHARRARMGGDQMSLAQMLKVDLKHEMPKDQQVSNWAAPDLTAEQLKYAADDALWTWRLWQHWQARLDEYPPARAAQAMLDDLIVPVHEMRETGLLLDQARHRDLVAVWEQKRDIFESNIRSLVSEEEVENLRSRRQWSDYFAAILPDEHLDAWPRTEKTGQLEIKTATCKEMASKAGGEGPLAEVLFNIADLTTVNQYLSNFGDKLITMAQNASDGRLHPSYNIARAVTGRFSSSTPNAQQFPRDRELLGDYTSVRLSFIAPPGKRLVSLDYSGIELKVLALLAEDDQLLYDCVHGDLHSEVGSYMAGYKIDKKTPEGKEIRSRAKGVSFGIIYGSGSLGLSGTLRTSVSRAQELINFWSDRYPKAFNLRNVMMGQALDDGYLRMVDGGTIFLGKKPDLPKCANYPVQRAALSVMARAIIRHRARLEESADRGRHLGTRMAATIHDALIDEARVDDAPEALQWMKEDMVAGYLDIFPGAPTEALVEGGTGPSWGELEDEEV
jgi:DNA polymerase-1